MNKSKFLIHLLEVSGVLICLLIIGSVAYFSYYNQKTLDIYEDLTAAPTVSPASDKSIATSTAGVLPPDPGEAGKKTLEGIDSDGDGVRDDAQIYIAITYPQSAKIRAALTQLAKATQAAILLQNGTARTGLSNALDCKDYTFMTSASDVEGGRLARDAYLALKKVVLNTPARTMAYLQADAAAGTSVVVLLPHDQMVTHCIINPSTLPN